MLLSLHTRRLAAPLIASVVLFSATSARAQAEPELRDGDEPPADASPSPITALPDDTPPPPPPAGGPVTIYVEPGAPPPTVVTRPPAWAPVPPAPAEAPRYDNDLTSNYPRRSHFVFRASVGPSIESFHGDRIITFGGEVAAGADTKAGSFSAVIALDAGKTEQSLGVWQLHIGTDLVWPIGPVRLGVEPRFGVVDIARVTTDEHFTMLTYGIGAFVGVDLFKSDGFTLAAHAVPRIESAGDLAIFGNSTGGALLGMTTLLDFRFRAPKRLPHAKPKPKPEPDAD